ncbi:substrate-binding domain-containing protein [bacterium]|nr:substrate-binding domain-containing protein [bacterium]
MDPPRRIAVMLDADRLTPRDRDIFRGIRRHADTAGWHLALDPYAVHHPAPGWEGVIVPVHRRLARWIRRCPVPVVSITWTLRKGRLPRAIENRHEAGRMAAEHLVERGYRHFAFAGFKRETQSSCARRAFDRALRLRGRRIGTALTAAGFNRMRRWWEDVMKALGGWLEQLELPVGIFVARPGLARALADLALARGLRIPQDVGIVAADDDPDVCEPAPALTAIRFDYTEVGRRAAELLGRLMDGERKPKQAILIPPTLMPRHSTDRQAVGDPIVAQALWFIDSRRTEFIRPADVAAALGVSGRTVQRRFRHAGRATVMQEIVKARIEHAKLLLGEEGLNLGTVARLSGFPSVQAMTHAFRRHVGMPPGAWRERHGSRR